MLVTGVGVGLTVATLIGSAVDSLPVASFSTGSAAVTMARQVGSVLGAAVLVAILDGADPATDPVLLFHRVWWFTAATAVLAGLASFTLVGSRTPTHRPGGQGVLAAARCRATVGCHGGREWLVLLKGVRRSGQVGGRYAGLRGRWDWCPRATGSGTAGGPRPRGDGDDHEPGQARFAAAAGCRRGGHGRARRNLSRPCRGLCPARGGRSRDDRDLAGARASPTSGTSTAGSRQLSGYGPKGPTTCSPLHRQPGSSMSWRRATPPGTGSGRVAR